MKEIAAAEVTGQVFEFSEKFFDQEDKKSLVESYGNYLASIRPTDILEIFNSMYTKNVDAGDAKNCISKLSSIFYKYLDFEKVHLPTDNYIINILLSENRKVELVISELKQILKKNYSDDCGGKKFTGNFKVWFPALKAYSHHHLKIERFILPEFGKVRPEYSGYFKAMKSYHREFSGILDGMQELLYSESFDKQKFIMQVGKLFFLVFLMIFREEYVFFPVAIQYIPENRWDEMIVHLQHPSFL